jgi:hypothetical protein
LQEPIDTDSLIASWGFRQSHTGIEYEFLDVFLRAVSQQQPLDVLIFKEGPLEIQNARAYVSGLTTTDAPDIVNTELAGSRKVAVLLRADFEVCKDLAECNHWICGFYKDDVENPEAVHMQIMEQTIAAYDQRVTRHNERALLADEDVLAQSDLDEARLLSEKKARVVSTLKRLFQLGLLAKDCESDGNCAVAMEICFAEGQLAIDASQTPDACRADRLAIVEQYRAALFQDWIRFSEKAYFRDLWHLLRPRQVDLGPWVDRYVKWVAGEASPAAGSSMPVKADKANPSAGTSLFSRRSKSSGDIVVPDIPDPKRTKTGDIPTAHPKRRSGIPLDISQRLTLESALCSYLAEKKITSRRSHSWHASRSQVLCLGW